MMTEMEYELAECVRDLIAIAETHIMQTYDRSGTTRRKIQRAEAALEKLERGGAGFIL